MTAVRTNESMARAGEKAAAQMDEKAENVQVQKFRGKRNSQQRNVYLPDYQHLILTAHIRQHDCLPQPVRQRESGGGGVLQSDGQEKQLLI